MILNKILILEIRSKFGCHLVGTCPFFFLLEMWILLESVIIAAMHQGIRPHKCHLCDKAYSKKSHLTVHLQTHEGKKRPYPCDMCDKSFSDSHNLKRHKMRHTGKLHSTLL